MAELDSPRSFQRGNLRDIQEAARSGNVVARQIQRAELAKQVDGNRIASRGTVRQLTSTDAWEGLQGQRIDYRMAGRVRDVDKVGVLLGRSGIGRQDHVNEAGQTWRSLP